MKRQPTANRNLSTPPPEMSGSQRAPQSVSLASGQHKAAAAGTRSADSNAPIQSHKTGSVLPEKRPWTAPTITEMTIGSSTMNGLPLGTPPGECCAYPEHRSSAYTS